MTPRSSDPADASGSAAPAAPAVRLVPTPAGDARVTVHRAGDPLGVLVAGHGAGGGIEAPDLAALAVALPPTGVTVALVEQPWRVAGRKVAPAPATLDRAWVPVVRDVTERDAGGLPVVVAGRSAGARVACRTAAETGAAGVVALAFPLHPPGRPERSRAGELLGAGVPGLIVQGERDTFGAPAEFPALPDGWTLVTVPAAGHAFTVPARGPVTRADVIATITAAVGPWAAGRLAGGRPRAGE